MNTIQAQDKVRIGTGRKVWEVKAIHPFGIMLRSTVPTGPRKGYEQTRLATAEELTKV